jgi:hypothetical protein
VRAAVLATLVSGVLALRLSAAAEERVDEEMIARIKMEAFQSSRVMDTVEHLTDVYGPRLTGSPNLEAASLWARDRLTSWGLADSRLEAWGRFGRGWSIERFSVEMTAPSYDRLAAYPHAWSPSTAGPIAGEPVLVEIAGKDDFAKYRGKLKGAIVLRGKPSRNRRRFEPLATRYGDEDVQELGRSMNPGEPASYWADMDEWEKDTEKEREIAEFFRGEGISVLLEPSERDWGIVHVAGLGYYLGNEGDWFPSFVVAKEQYGRMVRLLERKVPVELEISLSVKFHDEDPQGYNVIAELPGSDARLRDEIVMLGAHLDSWHSATGATDNATGSAAVMEAMRVLKAVGARPRRTIRLALWTGEEEGYFGSVGYVKSHFGDPDTMRLAPEHAKLSAYFNLDNGTGRIRGVYLQGNEAARPILEAYLKAFDYLEASSLTVQNTGGTDHLAFVALGLPGFQFVQDPVDYDTRTHHTHLDVYEAALEDDLKQASAILASVAYHAAMRDGMFPRPALPAPRTKSTESATSRGRGR